MHKQKILMYVLVVDKHISKIIILNTTAHEFLLSFLWYLHVLSLAVASEKLRFLLHEGMLLTWPWTIEKMHNVSIIIILMLLSIVIKSLSRTIPLNQSNV